MVNDKLTNYLSKKAWLDYYRMKLEKYKKSFTNKYTVIEKDKKIYHSDTEDYKVLDKIIKNTKSAIKTFEKSKLESKEQKLAENWLGFVSKNIFVNGVHGEYGVIFDKYIEDIPQFTDMELEKIDKYENTFNKILKNQQKEKTETDEMSL